MVAKNSAVESTQGIRTIHFLQPVSGGTPTVVLELVTAEVAAGYSVMIAAPKDLRDRAETTGATFNPLSLRRSPGPSDLVAIVRIRRLLKTADVVIFHSSKAMMAGKIALRSISQKRRPKSIAIPHSWSWNVGGLFKILYVRLEKWTRDWVDIVVCVSEHERDQGLRILGKFPNVVIRNAVDTDYFRPSSSNLKSERCRLLLVGRLCEQKGQDFMVPLMVALDDSMLALLGDGPSRDQLESMTQELNLGERVAFLGEGDVRSQYAAADIVVMPSRWEGMSLVLLEAMACGLPVVASPDASGDFDESNGVVTAGLTEEDFRNELRDLIDHQDRRAELGRRARSTAEAVLGLKVRNDAWLSLVHNLNSPQEVEPHRENIGDAPAGHSASLRARARDVS